MDAPTLDLQTLQILPKFDVGTIGEHYHVAT